MKNEKLSLDAFKAKKEAVVADELLCSINGGGGLRDFIWDYTIGKVVDFCVDNMINDWNSRSGGAYSASGRYASMGPY